jgi:hypothetical protein
VTDSLRGDALVDSVLAKIEEEGGGLLGMVVEEPEGLTPEELAGLSLPGGRPLPPSLAKFLAYDQDFLDVLEDGDDGKLALSFRTFKDMMAEQFDDETAENADFTNVLPGQCLVLPGDGEARRFMYVGEPDAFGEYPVFVVDISDIPFVAIEYPGLDVFLAEGVTEVILDEDVDNCFEHPVYGPMLEDQARRNFAGWKVYDVGGEDSEHLEGPDAVSAHFAG